MLPLFLALGKIPRGLWMKALGIRLQISTQVSSNGSKFRAVMLTDSHCDQTIVMHPKLGCETCY